MSIIGKRVEITSLEPGGKYTYGEVIDKVIVREDVVRYDPNSAPYEEGKLVGVACVTAYMVRLEVLHSIKLVNAQNIKRIM